MVVDIHGNIKHVKGDTGRLIVDIYDKSVGGPYTMQIEDTIKLKMRQKHKRNGASFEKTVTGTNQIDLYPEDTENLPVAEYSFSLSLTTGIDRYTLVHSNDFSLLSEV